MLYKQTKAVECCLFRVDQSHLPDVPKSISTWKSTGFEVGNINYVSANILQISSKIWCAFPKSMIAMTIIGGSIKHKVVQIRSCSRAIKIHSTQLPAVSFRVIQHLFWSKEHDNRKNCQSDMDMFPDYHVPQMHTLDRITQPYISMETGFQKEGNIWNLIPCFSIPLT